MISYGDEREMRQLIGKSCKLVIKDQIKDKILYYTAQEILEISETHILFKDKFGLTLAYRLIDVLQIDLI